ncbi:MAG: DUF1697 domain-containing protein [Thermoleophilaceae bacterium]|nr:DUF1697 domain-containing protein [Thermoleophilaceae bacterium]
MARLIALLRGINVGGHKKVEMARLRELMGTLGYRDVRTYVQSGNVVFTGPEVPPIEVAQRLEERIAATFGFDVSVMVRSREELADVIAANPLRDVATDPSRHLVVFRDDEVDLTGAATVDPADFAPEAFHVRGREIYLWAPDGVRDSPVVKALSEKRLGGTATARNWRTLEKLLVLAYEAG